MRAVQHGLLMFLMALTTSVSAQTPTQASIVDYLKSKKLDSSAAARKALYHKNVGGGDYTGTSEQNTAILKGLLKHDQAAQEAVSAVGDALRRMDPKSYTKSEQFSFVRFVNLQGGGLYGTFFVRAFSRVYDRAITGKNFSLAIDSAAARRFSMSVYASVDFYVENRKISSHVLIPAWFSTISQTGSTAKYLFLPEGTTVSIPKGQVVEARFSVQPTFTDSGVGGSAMVGAGAGVFRLTSK